MGHTPMGGKKIYIYIYMYLFFGWMDGWMDERYACKLVQTFALPREPCTKNLLKRKKIAKSRSPVVRVHGMICHPRIG